MILTDLALHNFRNHRNLSLKFKPGVTGIVGRNGKGKSSIVEGILFALTGKLFEGDRSDAIKLGESSGYVSLGFILDKKAGRIERHLDISKCVLTYDNIMYKKAGDVKALWDKLLQISPEIISRVVIAQQGFIPLLFCGDQGIREKIFQKIFLVPNTERIRKIVYDKYIKQAPPVIPVEDLVMLRTTKNKLEQELEGLKLQKSRLKLLSELEYQKVHTRLNFVVGCIDDAAKISAIQESLKAITDDSQRTAKMIEEYDEILGSVDVSDFKKQQQTLVQQQALYNHKLHIAAQLKDIQFPMTDAEYGQLQSEKVKIQGVIEALQEERVLATQEVKTYTSDLAHYRGLKGEKVCTTCKQSLDSVQPIIEEKEQQLAGAQKRLTQIRANLDTQLPKLEKIEDELAGYEEAAAKQRQLLKSQADFENISFDPDELKTCEDVLSHHAKYSQKRQDLALSFSATNNRIQLIEQQLNSMHRYDKDTDILAEKDELLQTLQTHATAQQASQQLEVSIKVKEIAIAGETQKLETTSLNVEKNERRNKYVAVLNQIYDSFHTSNFPQRLILKYADVVTSYLQEKLDNFDIPYKARVGDNFKIEMINEHGLVLPTISGGQKIEVGIALHMALHELFSQSFPLMILDEGTTHLDEENRTAYFELIQKIKQKNNLNQMLIIDHDKKLMDVVDNVIDLNL